MQYITIFYMETPSDQPSPFTPAPGEKEVRLVDVEVTNNNIAFNMLISFLNLAQNRGAFNLEESAKIWECVRLFIQQNAAATTTVEETA